MPLLNGKRNKKTQLNKLQGTMYNTVPCFSYRYILAVNNKSEPVPNGE